jgi:hypothetical protein
MHNCGVVSWGWKTEEECVWDNTNSTVNNVDRSLEGTTSFMCAVSATPKMQMKSNDNC